MASCETRRCRIASRIVVDKAPELTSRYYTVEKTVWLLGAVLLAARFLGVADTSSVPIIDTVLKDQQQLPRVLALLLLLSGLPLIFEWRASMPSARRRRSAEARLLFTIGFGLCALWFGYPAVVAGTSYANVNRLWFLGFVLLGFVIGELVSMIIDALVMIRSASEAERLKMPRIPAATHAQLIAFIPGSFVLGGVYYLLLRYASPPVANIAWLLVLVPIALRVIQTIAAWMFPHDTTGAPTTFAARKLSLQRIYDGHDYLYFLGANSSSIQPDLPVRPASPQEAQRIVRVKTADPHSDRIHFRVRLLKELSFEFFYKDGDPNNHEPTNRGVRAKRRAGRVEAPIKVEVLAQVGAGEQSQPMQLPPELVEACAEEYLASLPTVEDANPQKLFSYALDEAVRRHLAVTVQPAVYQAAMAGDDGAVREIIALGGNVNARGEFGWTPLLAAAAQGFPQIVTDLLNAGADPNVANMQGVTPLMFAARYGNPEICRILLDHHADVNSKDFYGNTALMTATAQGQYAVVEALLAAGADVSASNHQGKTALEIAQDAGYGVIARELRKAKARPGYSD